MKILVTGVNGFVGGHLAREINSQGFSVIGCGMDSALDPGLQNIVESYFGNCDLTSSVAASALPLKEVGAIINLAGLAGVGASFQNQQKYLDINVKVHTTIAEKLLKYGSTLRMVSISTGAVYDANQLMPLSESSKIANKASPYALSKIAMEKALQEYRKKGLDIIIVRPFNHIGPGQKEGFLLPDLAKQLSESDTITAGNTETSRDYTDVRDVVKAYVLLSSTKNLSSNVYNICSGKPRKGSELLAMLAKKMGKENYKTIIDKALLRPDDPAEIYGSYELIKKDTGWQPSIKLEKTIDDFVDAF